METLLLHPSNRYFYHPESGWPRDRVRPLGLSTSTDNPTTRKEKEREPGYKVNLNFPKRLPKLISCVFFLSRASWIKTSDCLTASSFCCFDYECVSEYVEHVLTGKKSTQAKLKKHRRFSIILCCTKGLCCVNTNLNTFFFSINAYNMTKAKCFRIFHFLCKVFLFRWQWKYFFLRQCNIMLCCCCCCWFSLKFWKIGVGQTISTLWSSQVFKLNH